MTIKVRRATMEDHEWLVEQCRDFMEFADIEFNEPHIRDMVASTVKEHLALIAADPDGTRHGMLIAMVMPYIYNPKKVCATELCWWVPRNSRHTTAGLALLATFIGWGKKNVDIVTMSLLANSPINPASLTKRGFQQRETAWVMEN